MARTEKIDMEVLAAREKKLSERLKQIRAKRRAMSRVQYEERIKRIVKLVEEVGLDRVSDAALESEFRRIVAEQTVPLEMRTNLNTEAVVEDKKEAGGDSDQPRRKWFGGS
jgi:hypothetical protein